MSTQNNTPQHILLDTCIIQYASDSHSGPEYNSYLADLASRGFQLAKSEYVLYELLQGAPEQKEQKLLNALSIFTTFQISTSVLIAASRLKTLYDMEKIPQLQIQDGDKIIAATAILTGSFILTANVNDYPRPFFVEMERKNILYRYKNTDRMIPSYILSPDFPVIEKRFANRPK